MYCVELYQYHSLQLEEKEEEDQYESRTELFPLVHTHKMVCVYVLR